jgi:hypothetical protein
MKPHAPTSRYADLTSDTFDRLLREVINDDNASSCDVLSIEGVYEILSEHYNKEVLERYEQEHVCEECGNFIPPSLPSGQSSLHMSSCSLHPTSEKGIES